jgi:hypothetical protein
MKKQAFLPRAFRALSLSLLAMACIQLPANASTVRYVASVKVVNFTFGTQYWVNINEPTMSGCQFNLNSWLYPPQNQPVNYGVLTYMPCKQIVVGGDTVSK